MNFTDQIVAEQIYKNRNWYLALGIALVALGSFAIFFAYTATIVSVIWLASILIVVGLIELVQAFKMRFWSKFFLHLILAALYIIAGGYMLINPMLNAVTLTLILAFFFLISGLFKILYALAYDPPHRGWVILNGALSLLLGILIWYQWPASGFWVIGLFMGIDAIFTGWSWIILSLAAKKNGESLLG